jgi:flagellar protein FlaG
MAIDGIGGVGALNVSSSVKPVKQAEPVTQTVNTGATGTQIQVADLPPVTPKGNSDGSGQQTGYRDDAAVQSDKEISPDKVKSAVDDLNKQVKQASPLHKTKLSFQYHDETNRISITVTDSDTDEVIREIPPEKALDMLAKAWEMAGLLVDEKR